MKLPHLSIVKMSVSVFAGGVFCLGCGNPLAHKERCAIETAETAQVENTQGETDSERLIPQVLLEAKPEWCDGKEHSYEDMRRFYVYSPEALKDRMFKFRILSRKPNAELIFNSSFMFSIDCEDDCKFEYFGVYGHKKCSYSEPGEYVIDVFFNGKDSNAFPTYYKDAYIQGSEGMALKSFDAYGDLNVNGLIDVAIEVMRTEPKKNFDKEIPFQVTYVTEKADAAVEIDMVNVVPVIAEYEVDCDGDGIFEKYYHGTGASCAYADAGAHQIAMRGIMPLVRPRDERDAYYLAHIDRWGSNRWMSMNGAFQGKSRMNILAQDAPELSRVTDMSDMFCGCEKMNSPINHWDVSHVTHMPGMFSHAKTFNQPLDKWDMSHVTDVSEMFSGTGKFNQNINTWDVSHVTNMARMFWEAEAFNQPLDKWDTSNVINMTSMFNATKKFNQNINTWDVSHVRYMSGMFFKAARFNQPLDKWDVSQVAYMADMFAYTRYNRRLRAWNLASLLDVRGMFEYSSSEKYTDELPVRYYTDMIFLEKIEARMNAIGREYDVYYNPKEDPWLDDEALADPPAYADDEDLYIRIGAGSFLPVRVK